MNDESPINIDGLDEATLSLLNQIRGQNDPKTGTRTLRDLSKLNISEAVELIRMLRTAAEFNRESPSQSNIVARQLFAALNEKVREVAPDIPSLLEQEAGLTAADEAVVRLYQKYLSEKSKLGKPIVYWSAAISGYLLLILVGNLAVAIVGAVVAAWAFWRSTLCITFRAAAWMRLAEMLDRSERRSRIH